MRVNRVSLKLKKHEAFYKKGHFISIQMKIAPERKSQNRMKTTATLFLNDFSSRHFLFYVDSGKNVCFTLSLAENCVFISFLFAKPILVRCVVRQCKIKHCS